MSKATERIAQQTAERMDKEVRGAWRAGYDYLHVYHPVQTTSWEPTEQFTVTYAVLPSNHPAATGLDHYRYSHSYELADLSRELVEQYE